MACLRGETGSSLCRPRNDHIAANTGASKTMKTAPNDWKYDAGISQPPIQRSVCSSAKKVSDAPACS